MEGEERRAEEQQPHPLAPGEDRVVGPRHLLPEPRPGVGQGPGDLVRHRTHLAPVAHPQGEIGVEALGDPEPAPEVPLGDQEEVGGQELARRIEQVRDPQRERLRPGVAKGDDVPHREAPGARDAPADPRGAGGRRVGRGHEHGVVGAARRVVVIAPETGLGSGHAPDLPDLCEIGSGDRVVPARDEPLDGQLGRVLQERPGLPAQGRPEEQDGGEGEDQGPVDQEQ